MLVACPSRDEIVASDWELERRGAPISLTTPAHFGEHQVDFHYMGVLAQEVAEISHTLVVLTKI